MSEQDQEAMLGRKLKEAQASKQRLANLRARAGHLADECHQIAWELDKAAGRPTEWERKPGMTLHAREFVTKDEFDRLVKALEAEQSRLAEIRVYLNACGIKLAD